jgi:hypothetical protein
MQPKPLALKILDIVAILLLAISAYLAIVFAPTERSGGMQRVFYFALALPGRRCSAHLAAVFSVVYRSKRPEMGSSAGAAIENRHLL